MTHIYFISYLLSLFLDFSFYFCNILSIFLLNKSHLTIKEIENTSEREREREIEIHRVSLIPSDFHSFYHLFIIFNAFIRQISFPIYSIFSYFYIKMYRYPSSNNKNLLKAASSLLMTNSNMHSRETAFDPLNYEFDAETMVEPFTYFQ